MGAWTGQYEGISKAKFEEMIAYAKAHGDKNMESFICCHASDEQGQYHDPETRAFWDEEERKDAAARVAQEARQTRVDKVALRLVEHLMASPKAQAALAGLEPDDEVLIKIKIAPDGTAKVTDDLTPDDVVF